MSTQTPHASHARHLTALLIGFILSLNTALVADEVEDDILVTATRSQKSQQDVLVATTVINREEIKNSGANDLAEILRFVAGIEIGRNGGPGQTTSVFMRGTESNHTLVLIDGVEMNPGTIGGAALQNINPDIIERIEIVKGPRSALYGSEAVGGVINVITRNAQQSSINTSLSYGSFEHKQVSASSTYRDEGRFASFTLAWQDTNGFASLRNQTEKSAHNNLSLNLQAGLHVYAQELEFKHWQASGNTKYYGFDTLNFVTAPLDQDFQNSVTALAVTSNLSDNWQSQVTLAQANDLIEQNQLDFFFFPEPQKDRVETERLSVDWQNSIQVNNYEIIAGAYFEREDADSLSFGSAFSDPTEAKALYASIDAPLGDIQSNLAMRYTDHETAGDQLSWNIDLGYSITGNLKTGLTSGRAFRAPDATDRYGFGGNPDLKTEESTSISAHLDWQTHYGGFKLEIFQTKIDDLIESVNIDPVNFIFQNINIAETEIKGIELAHKIHLGAWNLDTTATMQSPKNTFDDSLLLRRARRTLSTHVRRDFAAINFGLQLLASSERADIDAVSFAPVLSGGYVLANMTAAWQLNDNLSLFGKIDNLLDTEYATAAGYRQAERNYQLSLRMEY
ncbi:MAG: TonB-dependent receptor [Gammaproteobacteria bacterium]|nr:TonB-dependent receptor [Gammaproteobacteria bacterium]